MEATVAKASKSPFGGYQVTRDDGSSLTDKVGLPIHLGHPKEHQATVAAQQLNSGQHPRQGEFHSDNFPTHTGFAQGDGMAPMFSDPPGPNNSQTSDTQNPPSPVNQNVGANDTQVAVGSKFALQGKSPIQNMTTVQKNKAFKNNGMYSASESSNFPVQTPDSGSYGSNLAPSSSSNTGSKAGSSFPIGHNNEG